MEANFREELYSVLEKLDLLCEPAWMLEHIPIEKRIEAILDAIHMLREKSQYLKRHLVQLEDSKP